MCPGKEMGKGGRKKRGCTDAPKDRLTTSRSSTDREGEVHKGVVKRKKTTGS